MVHIDGFFNLVPSAVATQALVTVGINSWLSTVSTARSDQRTCMPWCRVPREELLTLGPRSAP